MLLRLYKESYIDPLSPGICRILFEGMAPAVNGSASEREFYLYVWIRESAKLHGFQAVLAESTWLMFNRTSGVSVGVISVHPVNRTMLRTDSAEDTIEMTNIIKGIHSEEFPSLTGAISRMFYTKALTSDIVLDKAEKIRLHKMTPKGYLK
jgi:hypothetical protein